MNTFSLRPSWRLAPIAAALSLTLVACGGGGNNDGGTPPVVTKKLRFEGAITDAPVANAAVTIHVGSQTFTTTADASGAYSLDVEVPESAASGFVSIDASGTGDQAFVTFTSLLGAFSDLIDEAGGDATLSPGENFGTQVTNVSTAQAALLRRANGGAPITSAAQLQSLASAVNGQDVLDLATAIKLAVDSAADYPLPEGFSSTLDLANDSDASTAFVSSTQAQDPDAFTATQAAIAGDPTLTKPISASSVPASLTAAVLSTDVGFTFNYTNRVTAYSFNSDGSGSIAAGSYNTDMTWTVDGSKVVISYAQPVSTTSFDFVDCNGSVVQAEGHYVSNGVTLALLSERTLVATETATVTYPDCANQTAHSVTLTGATTILEDDDFVPLTTADVADTVQTFYVYDSEQHAVLADVAQINTDGTGTALISGTAFNWSIGSGGVIDVTFANGIKGHYRSLRQVDTFTDDLFYALETGDGPFVDAGAQVEVDPAFATTIDNADDIAGRYYQFGIGNEQDPQPGVKGFRLRFDVGGTGSQEDDFIDNGNVVTVDSSNQPAYALRWTVENERIVARRTVDTSNGAYNCVAGATNCLLFDERTIVPLVDDNNRYYVIELRRQAFNGITPSTPRTALVRYYDYEPFAAMVQSAIIGKTARHGAQPAGVLRH